MENGDAADPVKSLEAQNAERERAHAALAAAVREGMARTGLRQRELASKFGVSPGRISHYLNWPDKMPVRWERIEQLLHCAGVDAADFAKHHGSFWNASPSPSGAADEKVEVRSKSGAVEAETIADSNAARTGIVLTTHLAKTDSPGHSLEQGTEALPATAPPSAGPARGRDSATPPRQGSGPLTLPPSRPVKNILESVARPTVAVSPSDETPTGPIPISRRRWAHSFWSRPFAQTRRYIIIALTAVVLLAITSGVWVALAARVEPTPPTPITPSSPPPAALSGVVERSGANGLTEHNSPSKNPQTITGRTVADGTRVLVDCAVVGDAVSPESVSRGYSRTWLRLQDGFYVTSVFVRLREPVVPNCLPAAAPLPLALIPG